MRILILYNAGQTYTSTVFEHLDSFRRFSIHEWHYLHYTKFNAEHHNLSGYQAFFIHYSVRLPFDQISESTAKALSEYRGIKGLFIQDEYDNVKRTKYWLNKILFDIVFTVVPQKNINEVYPGRPLPGGEYRLNLFLSGAKPNDGGSIPGFDIRSWTTGNSVKLTVNGVRELSLVKLPLVMGCE